MTLARQLVILISLLFTLMFAGTFLISLDNSRDYVVEQLASHAQDTSTSLALSLSPYLARGDQVLLQSMVDAIFDRGYYRLIRVEDPQGRTLYERDGAIVVNQVPGWFMRLFPLDTPEAESDLMAGWYRAGSLHVISHPGYAYGQLWRGSVRTLGWFAACSLAGLLLGLVLIRRLLKPLHAVENQARAICRGEFPIHDSLPWSRELRQVVLAMNRMTERVGQQFSEEAAIAEQLQRQAFVDPVTELGNRRHFDDAFGHLLACPEEREPILLLVQLRDLRAYNDRHGLAAGDALLRSVAATLRDIHAPTVLPAFRLGGGDFALPVSHGDLDEARHLARQLLQALTPPGEGDRVDINIGIAPCARGETVGAALARADQALRIAQQRGPGEFHAIEDTGSPIHLLGASRWRERLRRHLIEDTLVAHFQPILSTRDPGAWLHHELLLRAREDDGSLTPAGQFIPMAERVGLAGELDRRAVLLAARQIALGQQSLSVNLSPGVIREAAFIDWMIGYLRKAGVAERITLELPEHAVLSHAEAVIALARRLGRAGIGLGIDRFGRGLASFLYLKALQPCYLKLDGSLIRNIDRDADHEFFVRVLTTTAHEINIQVIAESVETEAERARLLDMNVDGLQGYLIQSPAPL